MLTREEAQAAYASAVGVADAFRKQVHKAREKWATCAPVDANRYRAKLAAAVAQHDKALKNVTEARRELHAKPEETNA